MHWKLAVVMSMFGWLLPAADGEPLTESVFTEIVKDASVLTEADKTGKPAKTNEVFRIPDLVRTGDQSRVELTAKDKTITRVGANTTFTFAQGGRDVILQKGGVLFHAPSGAGGGSVRYRGSSAAVLGTTFIAQVLADRSFKVLDLEGRVKVTLPDGTFVKLNPGEMVIIPPDQSKFSDTLTFNLGEVASHLLLVVGFSHPVASSSLIAAAINFQNSQIAAGTVTVNVSWFDAAQGLDFTIGGLNDSPFYFTGVSNPLDFPGQGIGPAPGISPAWILLPIFLPNMNPPSVVNPPKATNPNP